MSATAEDATCPTSLPQKQGTRNEEPAAEAQVSQVNDGPVLLVGLGRLISLTIVLIDKLPVELTCQTGSEKEGEVVFV